jgi:hypothetical protein
MAYAELNTLGLCRSRNVVSSSQTKPYINPPSHSYRQQHRLPCMGRISMKAAGCVCFCNTAPEEIFRCGSTSRGKSTYMHAHTHTHTHIQTHTHTHTDTHTPHTHSTRTHEVNAHTNRALLAQTGEGAFSPEVVWGWLSQLCGGLKGAYNPYACAQSNHNRVDLPYVFLARSCTRSGICSP